MGGPLCKSLYLVLILFQSFGWSKNSWIRKILIAAIIPFIQHSFADWLSFLLLATIKIKEQQLQFNKHLLQLFIFIVSSKPCPVFLQSHPKILCIPASRQSFPAQICPKMDLGLEFQKTNLKIRISILKT